jgi:hypothetical protein
MGAAVHEHTAAHGDEKVPITALPEFEKAFFSGNAVDGLPGVGHGLKTFPKAASLSP